MLGYLIHFAHVYTVMLGGGFVQASIGRQSGQMVSMTINKLIKSVHLAVQYVVYI